MVEGQSGPIPSWTPHILQEKGGPPRLCDQREKGPWGRHPEPGSSSSPLPPPARGQHQDSGLLSPPCTSSCPPTLHATLKYPALLHVLHNPVICSYCCHSELCSQALSATPHLRLWADSSGRTLVPSLPLESSPHFCTRGGLPRGQGHVCHSVCQSPLSPAPAWNSSVHVDLSH